MNFCKSANTCILCLLVIFTLIPTWDYSISSTEDSQVIRKDGKIGQGSLWETGYHIVESSNPGPTVLITAGIHGDELAGTLASEQISRWNILKGKLVVIPTIYKTGCENYRHLLPVLTDRDLDQNFPCDTDHSVRGELASMTWSFILDQKPDWHFDFHESEDFKKIDKSQQGNSIIYYPDEQTSHFSFELVDVINSQIDQSEKKFSISRFPDKGSLARATAEIAGSHSLVIETTKKEFIAIRTWQQRLMIHAILTELGMIDCDVNQLFGLEKTVGETRVAVYSGAGAQDNMKLRYVIDYFPKLVCEFVSPEEIRSGILNQFDVVILPGGAGNVQAGALQASGRDIIKKFVTDGGGYIGICAGAYLATDGFPWSLGIIDAKAVHTSNWKRGLGNIEIEVVQPELCFPNVLPGKYDVYYANGPILAESGNPDIQDFSVLAYFRTEIAEGEAPRGVMVDTPAIIYGVFGKGKVFVSSPHPEKNDETMRIILDAINYVSG